MVTLKPDCPRRAAAEAPASEAPIMATEGWQLLEGVLTARFMGVVSPI